MAGHARERSPGRWELRAFVGRDPVTGHKRYATKTVAATGRREADKLVAAFVADLDTGELTGTAGTVGDLLDQWMALKARRWSPSTVKEHRGMVDRYLRALRPIDVARLRTHDLDVFYAKLAERGGRCTADPRCSEPPCRHGGPLKPATVRRVHVIVRAAFQQAVKWGWIARNPAANADPGQVIEAEVEPPSDRDVVRLLAHAEEHDPDLGTFALVAAVTGARRGAICALRWSHVDLALGNVRFPNVIVLGPQGVVERPATRTKGTVKSAALDPYTTECLGAHRVRILARAEELGLRVDPDGYVFSDDASCLVPWRPDSLSRRFRRLANRAGLEEAKLHHLRHFMATTLLAARVDPKVVAHRGGWRKVATMLDRYAHALEVPDREAADLIGGLLRPRASLGSSQLGGQPVLPAHADEIEQRPNRDTNSAADANGR